MNNLLVRLGSEVEYAVEALQAAAGQAQEAYDATTDRRGEGGWNEIGDVAMKLRDLRDAVAAVLPEPIRKAIADADAELDDDADRADAASY